MNRYAAIRPVEKAAFSVYDMLWRIALPVLRKNRRLSVGFNNRILRSPLKGNADIWIQAASAGEAYLAWELLKSLPGPRRIDTVLTTNTLQGKEILDLAVADINRHGRHIEAQVTYFPFDMPSLMARAVHRVHPRVMVLLETEIWPGLLLALKQHACPTVIVNGRMTLKSFSRYKIWPAVWPPIGPDRILAISKEDAGRFAALFGHSGVTTMPNIKFDRVQKTDWHLRFRCRTRSGFCRTRVGAQGGGNRRATDIVRSERTPTGCRHRSFPASSAPGSPLAGRAPPA
ncbi:MAG: hypothetical protein JRE14_06695 [Deltaproteobacteria bacterium]|nr:hypothetical protein [Deltaproteobacteria bacterium]